MSEENGRHFVKFRDSHSEMVTLEIEEDKSITTYDNYSHMITKYIYPYFSEKGTTVFDLRPADIEYFCVY